MTEKRPCRWGVLVRQANAFGRFKCKLEKKKLEWKRFCEYFWMTPPASPPAAASETDFGEWTDSQHGTESSASNYNSQYFDTLTLEEARELSQQWQIPGLSQFEPGQSSAPGIMPLTVPSSSQQGLGMYTQQGEEECYGFHDTMLLMNNEGILKSPTYDQPLPTLFSPPLSVSEYSVEFVDTVSEWQIDDPTSLQTNNSQLGGNLISRSQMSIDTVESMDTRDTGDSCTFPPQELQCKQYLQWIRQLLDVNDKPSRGWRVLARIVYACRKLSRVLRMKQLQRNPPDQQAVPRRRFGDGRSQCYKGVRQRNGKWVSEIRIGRTNEKVWLGSFDTEKEAALAFDAGRHHCSAKRCKSFNFCASPGLLGPPDNLRDLSPNQRRKKIQKFAVDHAKAYGSVDIA